MGLESLNFPIQSGGFCAVHVVQLLSDTCGSILIEESSNGGGVELASAYTETLCELFRSLEDLIGY